MSILTERRAPAPPPPKIDPFTRFLEARRDVPARAGLVAVLLLQAVVILPPVVYLIWRSFTTGGNFGQATVASVNSFRDVLTSSSTMHTLVETLIFSAGSSLLAVALGVLTAWLVVRTNVHGKGFMFGAVFIGLAVPGMLRVIGWTLLLNPQNGLINQLLRNTIHVGSGATFENMTGMVIMEGLLWVPMGFLLMISPLRAMDGGLEEASAMCGASARRTYRRITLRLLAPAIASVAILAFIRVIQSFEVALFVGVPAHIPIWGAQIYLSVTGTPIPDYGVASAYSVLMLAGLTVAVILYNRLVRNSGRYTTVGGSGHRQRHIDLRRWRWTGAVLMGAIFLFEFLPAAYTVLVSFMPRLSGRLWGKNSPGWTLGNYSHLWGTDQIGQSLLNSVVVAIVTATVCVLLALVTSWFYVRVKIRFHRLPDGLAQIPIVVPGIVLGLATLVIYLRVPIPVYGTIWIFVLAFVPALLPFAVRYVQPALLQLSPQLTEQAAMCGGGMWRRARTVLFPLLGPAIIGAWILICVTSIRELSAAALLATQSSPIAASTMLDLWVNGNINQLSALGTIVIGISVAIAAVGYRLLRRSGVQA